MGRDGALLPHRSHGESGPASRSYDKTSQLDSHRCRASARYHLFIPAVPGSAGQLLILVLWSARSAIRASAFELLPAD
jgi:hypothetical protein